MLTASQVMTREVLTAGTDETVGDALVRMEQHGVRHLPAVDASGAYAGMLSMRSLAALVEADPTATQRVVGHVMAPNHLTASPDTPLLVLVDRMLAQELRAVPVLAPSTRRLEGIISYVDVVRALPRLAEGGHAGHVGHVGPCIGVASVLVPLGSDALSFEALRLTANLFHAAEIHALHVMSVPTPLVPTAFIGKVDSNTRVAHTTESIRRRAAELDLPREPRFVVRLGEADDEIVEYAREEGIRLIVIPSRERQGVKRMLLGSVAEHVVRHAPCPVLVLRGDLPDAWEALMSEVVGE